MTDEGDAKAQVLEYVLKGARDNKLEIIDQSLNDVQHGAAGTRVNVSVGVALQMPSAGLVSHTLVTTGIDELIGTARAVRVPAAPIFDVAITNVPV